MANPTNAGDNSSGSDGELSGGSGGTNCLMRFINRGIIKNVTFVSLIFFTTAEIVLSLNPDLLHKWLIDASICLTSTLLSGLCANFVSIAFIYVFKDSEKNYSFEDIVRTAILCVLICLKFFMGCDCLVVYRSTPKYLSHVPLLLDILFYVVDYFMSPEISILGDLDSELESYKKTLKLKFKRRDDDLKRDIVLLLIRVTKFESRLRAQEQFFFRKTEKLNRDILIRVAKIESRLRAQKQFFARKTKKLNRDILTRVDDLESSIQGQRKAFAMKKTKFMIRLSKLNKKNMSLNEKVSHLGNKIYALKSEKQRLLDGIEAQNNTLVKEKAILGFIIKGLKEGERKLIAKNIELTGTVSGLSAQISALNKEDKENQILNGDEVQINTIMQEHNTKKGLIDKILTDLDMLEGDNDTLKGETTRLTRRLSELEGEKSQLENEKSDMEKVLKKENDDELKGENSQLENEISDMEKVMKKENDEVNDELIIEEPDSSLNEKNDQGEKANVTDS